MEENGMCNPGLPIYNHMYNTQCTYVLLCLVFMVALVSLTWAVAHEESKGMIECEAGGTLLNIYEKKRFAPL